MLQGINLLSNNNLDKCITALRKSVSKEMFSLIKTPDNWAWKWMLGLEVDVGLGSGCWAWKWMLGLEVDVGLGSGCWAWKWMLGLEVDVGLGSGCWVWKWMLGLEVDVGFQLFDNLVLLHFMDVKCVVVPADKSSNNVFLSAKCLIK